MTAIYKWQEVYKAALLETNSSNMEERIRAAESAIQERRRELLLNHGGSPEENQAIMDAVNSLTVLRAESESWSARKSEEAS